jgi:nucleotide-binding universal stress UspA family protein
MQPSRTILFAADFSENSKDAFSLACSLAVENKTRVFVVQVIEPNAAGDLPDASSEPINPRSHPGAAAARHEALKREMAELYKPNHPIEVEYLVRKGNPTEEILRVAGQIGSDLIVVGSHGRTGLRRLLAGSVATAVLRRAACPVVVLRRGAGAHKSEQIQTVLHPTDFSDCSEAATRIARSLARDHGARLIILHVLPYDVILSETSIPVDPEPYRAALEELGKQLDGPDLKFPVEPRFIQGDATAEILRTAAEVGCDLIVMGTHGRTGLGRLLLGNVAESVLPEAQCAVLVVKAPGRMAPPTSDQRSRRSAIVI